MIKNSISFVTRQEAETIKTSINASIFVAEIEGKKIKTEEDYFREVWLAFDFPPALRPSWAGHDDWIRDLDWLNADGYLFFVYDFPQFLRNDHDSKAFFAKHFQDFILPFWEDEVTRVVVGGKAKSFNVYLVE
jgi:hypothetical protein